MYPIPKIATDMDGHKIKVGDSVQYFSIYDKKPKNIVQIVRMHRQGRDGTILHFDNAPDSEYQYYKECAARAVRKV